MSVVRELSDVRGTVASLPRAPEPSSQIVAATARILDAVARDGSEAVARFNAQFDAVRLAPGELRISRAVLAHAHALADPAWLADLRAEAQAAERLARAGLESLREQVVGLPDARVRTRWSPRRSAAFYLRRGASFDARALAGAVGQARGAGVRRLVAVTPPRAAPSLPGAWGVSPQVLAAAAELEFDELFLAGGAQGVALLASWLEPGDVLTGAAGPFATEAKRQLAHRITSDVSRSQAARLVILESEGALEALAEQIPGADGPTVVLALDRSSGERIAKAHSDSDCLVYVANRDQAVVFAQTWSPPCVALFVAEPARWFGELSGVGTILVSSLTDLAARRAPVPLAALLRAQSIVEPIA